MPRPRLRGLHLTQRRVDALRPEGSTRVTHWDDVVRGLGVRVSATSKTYVLRFTPRGRAQRFETLGDASVLTLDDARAHAKKRIGDAGVGDSALRTMTVEELFAHYKDHHRSRRKKRVAGDDRNVVRRLEVLEEAWRGRLIHTITHADVSAVITRINARKKLYEANRVRALIRNVWNEARVWAFVPATMPNPVEGTHANREHARDVQAFKPDEVRRLIEAADRYGNPWAAAAIKMLALTGCRTDEVLQLRWEDVDFADGVVVLRDRKGADNLRLAVTAGVVTLLRALPRASGSLFVFPSVKNTKTPMRNLTKAWRWALGEAGLRQTRVYDLRASLATTVAATSGLKAAKVALGHADERTTMRYIRPATDDVRRAVARHERAVMTSAPRTRAKKAKAS